MFEGVLGIIANGAVTLVLWYGAKLMYEGHVSAGVLTCKYKQPVLVPANPILSSFSVPLCGDDIPVFHGRPSHP